MLHLARAIAPAAATDEEIEWRVAQISDGTSPEVARDRLQRRRDSALGSAQRVPVHEETRRVH